MDHASRRWVLKSLSPPLHPRDLRSVTGPSRGEDDSWAPDGPAPRARPLVVSPDGGDERRPDGSSGSRDGFYSFVEDPTSPEAELNEAWMLSPHRQVHLTTLKEDRAFKVQTYAGGKKTQSLFPDSDSPYRVRPQSACRAFGEEEEKQLRKEIIQKQAPKRKSTFKPSERLGGPQKLDRGGPSNAPTKGSGPVDRPGDPGAIDRAQIDFGAARRQFLDLERGRRDVPARSRRSRVSRETEGADAPRSPSGKVETFAESGRTSGPSGAPTDPPGSSPAGDSPEEACPRSVSGEDGLLQTTGEAESDRGEKEIRLIQEREENLRRARGLKHTDGFSELRALSLPSPRKKEGHGSAAVRLESRQKNGSRKGPEELFDPRKEDRDQEELLSPCCPHRHAQETSSAPSPTTPPRHVPSWTAALSWRSKRESAAKRSAPDFIAKEIEEALLRERKLRESRRSRESSQSKQAGESGERGGPGRSTESGGESGGESAGSGPHSATPLVERASKAGPTRAEAVERAGPTGAPPRDSEERRERRRADDGSYAGIRAVDDIDNQVVEATRVIRHKSQRALRWEAGLFANRLRH